MEFWYWETDITPKNLQGISFLVLILPPLPFANYCPVSAGKFPLPPKDNFFCSNLTTNLKNSVILYGWGKHGMGHTHWNRVHLCVCVSECKTETEFKHHPPILLMVSFRTICPLRQHSNSTASTITVGFGVKDRHVV